MKNLDCTRFVVLGEGLAAGMTNFSLIEADQRDSFPAQIARQMKVDFAQPLIQGPGIGDAPGFQRLPVRLPLDHQTTVLSEFPPSQPFANLSIPGLTLSEALTRRPAPPLVRKNDALQTAINLILGIQGFIDGEVSSQPTQLEYALKSRPTLAVIELGFAEALEAAVAGKPDMMPDPGTFRSHYDQMVKALTATGSEVVAMTIPDPVDTAYFSPLDCAARVLKVPAPMVAAAYGLREDDRVAVDGLTEMGYQLISRKIGSLPQGSVLSGHTASEICGRVAALNREIAEVAQEHGALLYDLHALFMTVRKSGAAAGGRTLTADFLGGFYSLDGYYPGKTGQALIANGILELLNSSYGTGFTPIDIGKVMEGDPVAMYRQAEGPDFSPADLAPPGGAQTAPAQAAATGARESGPRGGQVTFQPGLAKQYTSDPHGSQMNPKKLPLTLPPGLEEVLPLDKRASYYGDALRAAHTANPQEAFYGLTGNLLFGGLAMLDSHLNGSVRIKFSPPVDNIAHFEVTHGEGLVGDEGRLSAPQFFKLPAFQHKLMDSPDAISSGDLNLATGEVTNLKYFLFFMNSAIFSLAQVNPALPRVPMAFPGQYGSAWARFEQRDDGLLDFELYGTTFIPMSAFTKSARFPLPFCSPTLDFASIPCDGTSLHPHIHLSTAPLEGPGDGVEAPELPNNSICVFTAPAYSNYFGDDFSLNASEIGGPGTGRSQLIGQYQIQFGERFGDSVSVSISSLQAGGVLRTLYQTPIAQAFMKRIPDSMLGHDEFLRFPKQTYDNSNISWLDDPLDLAVGAVDLRTGKFIGHLLRRGMITTSWILAMIRLEPRTPKSTFTFRGPAAFEKCAHGGTVFRYYGDLHIPFPEGFSFPNSDLETPITIGPNSALDPYLRFQGICGPDAPNLVKRGRHSQVTASNCIDFSYSYEICNGPVRSSFEYSNMVSGGKFVLKSLTWVEFFNSRFSTAPAGDCDTVFFSGFGTWSLDPDNGLHVATVHISTAPDRPYVSILIDGGKTSHVNTRPPDRDATLP